MHPFQDRPGLRTSTSIVDREVLMGSSEVTRRRWLLSGLLNLHVCTKWTASLFDVDEFHRCGKGNKKETRLQFSRRARRPTRRGLFSKLWNAKL
ncbi:unnamed protein product [Calypogeia fissa]